MDLPSILKQYWGFDRFLPLQEEAMESVLAGRDSVVVLPTGGGKSLCFQAPALVMPGLAVVVSPLISLMKDQVDSLTTVGVSAAFLNSSLTAAGRRDVIGAVCAGTLKILYVAPERLVKSDFLDLLGGVEVSFFAVDEAHCISMWGHDFRPEYRGLRVLRERFPRAGVHAYTATATARVRDDIRLELELREAEVLVGSFDRPNLIYKVERRSDRLAQILAVLERHRSESCIVYCIRRKDVDNVAASLASRGFRALPYHAGMSDEERRLNQEAFVKEDADVIVATVAFGMGIDKSNVRCVIHAGVPKSLEHYQQETGRAGRDGLDAECRLFFSGGDFAVWRSFVDAMEPEPAAVALRQLNEMYSYCTGLACRHRSLVGYFGQEYEGDDCGACDVCLGEIDLVVDALVLAQKIISCVVRLRERFGAGYTAKVLCGSKEERIVNWGHDQLSTYALLADDRLRDVRDWIEQLVDQDYLSRSGEYKVLGVSPRGRRVLRGEETPLLLKPAAPTKPARQSKAVIESWDGVDRGLFEILRELRLAKSRELGVPAFVVFGDASLRDMARRKPTGLAAFLDVHGVGEKKCADFGEEFVAAVVHHLEGEASA
jgi:ATP-dependent DNA helicase RecQ